MFYDGWRALGDPYPLSCMDESGELLPGFSWVKRSDCGYSIVERCGERFSVGTHRDDEGLLFCALTGGIRDTTPAVADVVVRMSQIGESQDEAVRSLGGQP